MVPFSFMSFHILDKQKRHLNQSYRLRMIFQQEFSQDRRTFNQSSGNERVVLSFFLLKRESEMETSSSSVFLLLLKETTTTLLEDYQNRQKYINLLGWNHAGALGRTNNLLASEKLWQKVGKVINKTLFSFSRTNICFIGN